MKKTIEEKPEIKLVGISVRTSYQNETSKDQGKIGPCVQRYFHNALFDQIPNRKNPGVTFCIYTDYESDYTGAYTYFIGEEVESLETPLPEEFDTHVIPRQDYAKFTTNPGPMPDVLINAWNNIWNMSSEDLGGKRLYHSDFEIYDERAADHNNVVLDVFIGIDRNTPSA